MSASDDFARVVGTLRGWGFDVREEGGCYGRSNGIGWSHGVPVGHINHHYVCSMNPDQGYIDNLVQGLADNSTVNWFADVNGRAYLIGTGPMNHSGTGNSSVLDRTINDEPPPGPAGSAGDMTGNSYYSGTECQHPGDSTPWPGPMLDVMVAINAAEFLVWGYSANRAINHFEWTNRKIDMSAGGGADSGGWAGDELRRRVADRMAGGGGGGSGGGGGGGGIPGIEEDDVMQLIQANDGNGAIFAYSPGRFIHVPGPDHLNVGTATGLWSGEVRVVSQYELDVLRDNCCGNGAGKGDNLIDQLPSDIAG